MDAIRRQIDSFWGKFGFCAFDSESRRSISHEPNLVLEIASTFKLLPMITAYRQHHDGDIDLDAVVTTSKGDHVGGSGILRELNDDVTTTVRNLIRLMIILSDNVATLHVLRRVGVDAANETAKSLGLPNTCFYAPKADRRGYGTSTPAELVQLMTGIVEGTVADPQSCSEMRSILGRQFYLDQIPRFLPVNQYAADIDEEPAVRVLNKTGFGVGIRSDIASIEFRGHKPLYLACISNWDQDDAARRSLLQEPASLLHATVARLAIDSLRPGQLSSPYIPFSERSF
ncbi:MAG: serine hydrolase [Pseudomonadales bacterium]